MTLTFYLLHFLPIIIFFIYNYNLFSKKVFLTFIIPSVLFNLLYVSFYYSVDNNQYIDTLNVYKKTGQPYTDIIRGPIYGIWETLIFTLTRDLTYLSIIQAILNSLCLTYFFKSIRNLFNSRLFFIISILLISLNAQRIIYNSYTLTEGISSSLLVCYFTTLFLYLTNIQHKNILNMFFLNYFSVILYLTKTLNIYLVIFSISLVLIDLCKTKKIITLISMTPILFIFCWCLINNINLGTYSVASFSGYSMYGILGYNTDLKTKTNYQYKRIIKQPLENIQNNTFIKNNRLAQIESFMWGSNAPLEVLSKNLNNKNTLESASKALAFEIIITQPEVFLKHIFIETKSLLFQKLHYIAYAIKLKNHTPKLENSSVTKAENILFSNNNYHYFKNSKYQTNGKIITIFQNVFTFLLIISQYKYFNIVLPMLIIIYLLKKATTKKVNYFLIIGAFITGFQTILTTPFVMGLERYFYPNVPIIITSCLILSDSILFYKKSIS